MLVLGASRIGMRSPAAATARRSSASRPVVPITSGVPESSAASRCAIVAAGVEKSITASASRIIASGNGATATPHVPGRPIKAAASCPTAGCPAYWLAPARRQPSMSRTAVRIARPIRPAPAATPIAADTVMAVPGYSYCRWHNLFRPRGFILTDFQALSNNLIERRNCI
jgi:hypothetical protein